MHEVRYVWEYDGVFVERASVHGRRKWEAARKSGLFFSSAESTRSGRYMTFSFSVPTPSGTIDFQVEAGTSLLFVGANGGGKTRLAVKIENDLGDRAHRISAHRALTLNPTVAKISERIALLGLRTGHAHEGASLNHRIGQRWQSNAAVSMLNDYDHLVQVLFADQANTSLETHKNARAGTDRPASATKFEKLVEIWDLILPNRSLEITGDDIQASIAGASVKYRAADMSDAARDILFDWPNARGSPG